MIYGDTSKPKFAPGDLVVVKECMWPWHVGKQYVIQERQPYQHDDVPDGDEWWYYIDDKPGPGYLSVLPESVLALAGQKR